MFNGVLPKTRKNAAMIMLALIIGTRLLLLFTAAPTNRIGEDVLFLRISKYIATSGELLPVTEPVFGLQVYYGPLLYWADAVLYRLAPYHWIFLSKALNLLLFVASLLILARIAKQFVLSPMQKAAAYGVFGLLNSSVAISLTNMHEGLLLFGTMLGALCVLRMPDRWSYLGLFAAGGIVMLTRYQAVITLAGLLIMMAAFHTERKTKLKMAAALVLGVLLLSGWWYLRNWEVHGTPFYHPDPRISSFSLEYALTTPIGTHVARVIDAYYHGWGIPLGRGALEASIFGVSADLVSVARTGLGLFLLPLYGLFALAAWRQKKGLLVLLPIPVLFLVHGLLHAPIIGSNTAARYMLPGIPLFALVLAKSADLWTGRRRKAVMVYLLAAMLILASLGLVEQLYKAQREDALLNSFYYLLEGNHDKQLVMLARDDLIRGLVDLHFNVTAIPVDSFACDKVENQGVLNYCYRGEQMFVYSDQFYLFKKF